MWVVLGQTASGKSGLGMELARRCGGEILCFDSTTVYRGLDVGTAKPSPAEQEEIPHHLLDLVEPGQEFSLVNFLQAAEAALAGVRSRGRQPLLVGGSFLYLRAFLEGYRPPEVPPDPAFRAWAEQQPLQQLVDELLERDPECRRLDLKNPRRVVRALEVCRAGGRFSDSQGERRPEPVRKVGLQCEPEWLQQRILKRTHAMLESGFQEEVAGLCQKGLLDWLLSQNIIGYREIVLSLSHPVSREELAAQVAASTWRLAKKQRTWARSERGVEWFAADQAELVDRVWTRLNEPKEI